MKSRNGDVYLLVNLSDLDLIGSVAGIGTPLHMMVRPELGDKIQQGAYKMGNGLDDMGIMVETTRERANAIADGINVVARRRLRRNIRAKILANLPDKLF